MEIAKLFDKEVSITENYIELSNTSDKKNQSQTNAVFSEKWTKVLQETPDRSKNIERQRNWYKDLYGFQDFEEFRGFLSDKKVILDAGCGLGEKAAWFAELAPEAIVIGMDYSESVYLAREKFKEYKNLYFIRGDIANTGLKEGSVDYVSCDQVIMHTENPEYTFRHLSGLLPKGGEFSCYVYRKKALPRELLDNYFRNETHNLSTDELWKFSEQLTELGKNLSELNVKVQVPDIPLIGIKGGEYDIQRFIYWNFIKCFWNEDLGYQSSKANNFDWYSPSNAKRYSEEEFRKMITDNNLEILYFHEEEACYSGRFRK